MKKRIILTLFTCFIIFSLVACGSVCMHPWGEYQFDENYHWREYTCEHTAPDNKTVHVDATGDDLCDVCGCTFDQNSLPPSSSSTSSDSSIVDSSINDDNSNSSVGDDVITENYLYTEFTAQEKALFNMYIGTVIPFAPNNEYYVEGYYDTYGYEYGMSFYTFGNTKEDFTAYLLSFDGYTLQETYEDEYGDTWYCLTKGDVVVDLSYYYYEGEWVIDLYVYSTTLSKDPDDSTDTPSGGETVQTEGVITNKDKGLPANNGTGIYNVDFTLGEKVKDVTDQSYYVGGCPTTGEPGVLVIPVEFSDVTASSKGYTVDTLKNAFEKNGNCDYYSLYDYYFKSSNEQLQLNIKVLDSWFRPKYNSSYYYNATIDYSGYEMAIGDQMIMDEALNYLEDKLNLADYDSDNNGYIDAIILVNTLDVGEEDFYWAYRYWNYYTDQSDNYYEYDGVCANDYVWASYQFLHESYDSNGNVNYNNTNGMNTYTFIHEFGHILGADDYYDTSSKNDPMAGCDVMDAMLGDHNAFTKFNFGWITSSRLVVTDSSVTLTLTDFSSTGDTIIFGNNWDSSLGAYQEYYVVAYYTNQGLNGGDAGYFSRDGVVVYHVNASLILEEEYGEKYYDVYNNNTDVSSSDGTQNNLIEYVKSANDTYTYVAGDSLPIGLIDDNGDALGYTFTVDSISNDTVTITFTKVA